MAQCPVCSGDIAEDFGLVDCPHCGSPVLLSDDGTADATPADVESHLEPPNLEANLETLAEPQAEPPPLAEDSQEVVAEDPVADIGAMASAPSLEAGLFYTVTLHGIDTAAIRTDIKDSLTDLRLRLNVGQLLGEIHHGKLVLPRMNSVKAAVVVQRLRILPIEITWAQERE